MTFCIRESNYFLNIFILVTFCISMHVYVCSFLKLICFGSLVHFCTKVVVLSTWFLVITLIVKTMWLIYRADVFNMTSILHLKIIKEDVGPFQSRRHLLGSLAARHWRVIILRKHSKTPERNVTNFQIEYNWDLCNATNAKLNSSSASESLYIFNA